MDKGGGGNNIHIPNPPSFNQGYSQGTNTYLGDLGTYLNNEQSARTSYDPQRIAEQQSLQSQFGPNQYAQQLDALRTIDPTGYNLRENTAGQIGNYEANNNALVNRLGTDLQAGTSLTPGQDQSLSQDIQRTQAARGNVYGQAPVQEEAFTKGMAGQQLYQQRIGNYMSALGQQGQGIQSALGFQNSATPESMINQIAPVSADRSMAYVNPNAGFLGVNALNASYQNQLGAAAASLQPSTNPWGSVLGTAATVAPLLIGAFSDPKLKSNVTKVGKVNAPGVEGGLNAYKYDINPPKRTEIGVMADEVAKKRPDAVRRDPASGYLKVMYNQLGLPRPMPVAA